MVGSERRGFDKDTFLVHHGQSSKQMQTLRSTSLGDACWYMWDKVMSLGPR
jgi:hypothetical protein